jgi:hypothetical protein
VDVYQDGTHSSSTLPTYFAPLFGVSSQGTQATATAQAAVANATDCLKPFGIPDLWTEIHLPVNSFDGYETNGPNKGQPVANPDVYTPPSTSSTGTGYNVAGYYGTQVTLHVGGGGNSIAPGDWMAVDLPDGAGGYNTGGSAYSSALATCTGHAVGIGDYMPVESGNMKGPTVSGIGALVALDPSASWSGSGPTGSIVNSCAPGICADGNFHTLSPRVAAIAVYNPDEFQYGVTNNSWPSVPACQGGKCVHVTNILGFFVSTYTSAGDITGYLFNYPGTLKTGSSTVGIGSGFTQFIQLVR